MKQLIEMAATIAAGLCLGCSAVMNDVTKHAIAETALDIAQLIQDKANKAAAGS